jgi:hypothetical protein
VFPRGFKKMARWFHRGQLLLMSDRAIAAKDTLLKQGTQFNSAREMLNEMALEIERDECLVSAIINQYCSSSFETASEPVIGPRGACHRARVRATRCADPLAASSSDECNRARAGMRSNLLKHNNLMPASRLRRYRWRSEPTGPASGRPDDRLCERLEAWAASDPPLMVSAGVCGFRHPIPLPRSRGPQRKISKTTPCKVAGRRRHRRALDQYLTRRANHRHMFNIARIKPAPGNWSRAF